MTALLEWVVKRGAVVWWGGWVREREEECCVLCLFMGEEEGFGACTMRERERNGRENV